MFPAKKMLHVLLDQVDPSCFGTSFSAFFWAPESRFIATDRRDDRHVRPETIYTRPTLRHTFNVFFCFCCSAWHLNRVV